MRQRFRIYCADNHPDLEIFLPEFAMTDYFANLQEEQFDLSNFENIIGSLAHSILIFPEAAGSYAET